MNINLEDAKRLQEIRSEMDSLLNEFKDICRNGMSREEYNDFRYQTLGHLEPGLNEDTEWVTRYSSINSLEKVTQNAVEEATGETEEESED